MRTFENIVSSFLFYMWNSWCEEECRIVFASAGYKHFWNKWCIAANKTAHGAAEKFYAELSEHNRALLVNRACELYNGNERRSLPSVVSDKELYAYIFPASRLERNANDESNSFATVTDRILNIALTYLKTEVYYLLPNNKQIELLSEMRMANYDFGDFDEPIEDLRKAYYETSDEAGKKLIEQKIEAQCFAFADFLGMQDEEMQSMISIDNLSIGIKQALLAG